MPSFSFFAGGSLVLLWRLCLFFGFVAHLLSGTKESLFHLTDELCGRLFQQAGALLILTIYESVKQALAFVRYCKHVKSLQYLAR